MDSEKKLPSKSTSMQKSDDLKELSSLSTPKYSSEVKGGDRNGLQGGDAKQSSSQANPIPAENGGGASLDERIKRSTEAGGLKEIPASFEDQDGDWNVVWTDGNPFRVLYLDYLQHSAITPGIVQGNYDLIKKFWRAKVELMETGANKVKLINKYGGPVGSDKVLRAHLKKVEDAKKDLDGGISGCFEAIEARRLAEGEKYIIGQIEQILHDEHYEPSECEPLLNSARKTGLSDDEAFRILHKHMVAKGFKPLSGKLATDLPVSRQLETEWATDGYIARKEKEKLEAYERLREAKRNNEERIRVEQEEKERLRLELDETARKAEEHKRQVREEDKTLQQLAYAAIVVVLVTVVAYVLMKPQPPKVTMLSVKTTPDGAVLYLDKDTTEHETPVDIKDITPGAHVVLLRKKGYKDCPIEFTLASGESKIINVTMEKKGSKKKVEVAVSTPAPAEVSVPQGDTPATGVETRTLEPTTPPSPPVPVQPVVTPYTPPPTVNTLNDDLNDAIDLYNKKQYDGAKALFNAVLRKHPDNRTARNYLDMIKDKQQKALTNYGDTMPDEVNGNKWLEDAGITGQTKR